MTREAQFHQWALARVDEVPEAKRDEYKRYVRNGCSLIITSGATQTIAYFRAKGGVHELIATHLHSAPGLPPNRQNARDYMAYTRCLRRALTHLKLAIEIERATHASDEEEDNS